MIMNEEATGGGKEQAAGVLGREKEPLVIDEEDYLAQHGASRLGIGDSALHKNIPEGKQRKRLLDNQAKKDWELLKKRERLRSEYREKVEKGEIRPPTRIEKLIDTARGHPDNESTQAARRILEKRGIDWYDPTSYKAVSSWLKTPEEGRPDEKCVQVGKVCVERLGGVDRAEVKKAMDRLLETIERSLETVQSCIEVSKRTLRVSGEEA